MFCAVDDLVISYFEINRPLADQTPLTVHHSNVVNLIHHRPELSWSNAFKVLEELSEIRRVKCELPGNISDR